MSTTRQQSTAAIDDGFIRIERIFDAPRELVFRAWSDPAHLTRWYAPKGCALTHCKADFRAGGTLHFCIRNPDGFECCAGGEYREIVVPERIVYTLAFADREGRRIEKSHVADPDWPGDTVVTVVFDRHEGNKTRLVLHQTVLESVAKRTGAYPGWLSMLDRLAEQLAEGAIA